MLKFSMYDYFFWAAMLILPILSYFVTKWKIKQAFVRGINTEKLYIMRSDGQGPDFILLGGKPFYRQVEVDRWQRAQGEADSPGDPDEAPPDCMNARGGASSK